MDNQIAFVSGKLHRPISLKHLIKLNSVSLQTYFIYSIHINNSMMLLCADRVKLIENGRND